MAYNIISKINETLDEDYKGIAMSTLNEKTLQDYFDGDEEDYRKSIAADIEPKIADYRVTISYYIKSYLEETYGEAEYLEDEVDNIRLDKQTQHVNITKNGIRTDIDIKSTTGEQGITILLNVRCSSKQKESECNIILNKDLATISTKKIDTNGVLVEEEKKINYGKNDTCEYKQVQNGEVVLQGSVSNMIPIGKTAIYNNVADNLRDKIKHIKTIKVTNYTYERGLECQIKAVDALAIELEERKRQEEIIEAKSNKGR